MDNKLLSWQHICGQFYIFGRSQVVAMFEYFESGLFTAFEAFLAFCTFYGVKDKINNAKQPKWLTYSGIVVMVLIAAFMWQGFLLHAGAPHLAREWPHYVVFFSVPAMLGMIIGAAQNKNNTP